MDLPKRKSTRLKGYDYSGNGVYFLTICTHDKQKLLSEVVGEGLCALPSIKLTDIGCQVNKAVEYIQNNYDAVTVDNYIIMPNHVHMLITIDNYSGGHGSPPLQDIIGRLKSYTTKLYGEKLWQRSFHDHTIRDDRDYQKIWEYIEHNAAKWSEDCFYIK